MKSNHQRPRRGGERPSSSSNTAEGILERKGRVGFVLSEQTGLTDILVQGASLKLAMNGDRVRVRLRPTAAGGADAARAGNAASAPASAPATDSGTATRVRSAAGACSASDGATGNRWGASAAAWAPGAPACRATGATNIVTATRAVATHRLAARGVVRAAITTLRSDSAARDIPTPRRTATAARATTGRGNRAIAGAVARDIRPIRGAAAEVEGKRVQKFVAREK